MDPTVGTSGSKQISSQKAPSHARPRAAFLLGHASRHGPWFDTPLVDALHELGHHAATVARPSIGDDPARLGSLYDDRAAAAAELPGSRCDRLPTRHPSHTPGFGTGGITL